MSFPNLTHVSPHLRWTELACRDAKRTPYPSEWRDRAVLLATEFEALRARCGGVPLVILSAFRTPAHNARVGGAAKSYHVQGLALDLQTRAGWSVDEFFAIVRDQARARGPRGERLSAIRGLGKYPWGVHVDLRPGDKFVIWHGTSTPFVGE